MVLRSRSDFGVVPLLQQQLRRRLRLLQATGQLVHLRLHLRSCLVASISRCPLSLVRFDCFLSFTFVLIHFWDSLNLHCIGNRRRRRRRRREQNMATMSGDLIWRFNLSSSCKSAVIKITRLLIPCVLQSQSLACLWSTSVERKCHGVLQCYAIWIITSHISNPNLILSC